MIDAWIAHAVWLIFNALFVGFLVWRGYCRDRKRKRVSRAKRARIYENLRSIQHTN